MIRRCDYLETRTTKDLRGRVTTGPLLLVCFRFLLLFRVRVLDFFFSMNIFTLFRLNIEYWFLVSENFTYTMILLYFVKILFSNVGFMVSKNRYIYFRSKFGRKHRLNTLRSYCSMIFLSFHCKNRIFLKLNRVYYCGKPLYLNSLFQGLLR